MAQIFDFFGVGPNNFDWLCRSGTKSLKLNLCTGCPKLVACAHVVML